MPELQTLVKRMLVRLPRNLCITAIDNLVEACHSGENNAERREYLNDPRWSRGNAGGTDL